MEVGSACTVGPGGVEVEVVAADEVVVGGEVEDDVEPAVGGVEGAVVTHRNETLVGASDHIQYQAGNSASLIVSGLVAEFSRPESGDSG